MCAFERSEKGMEFNMKIGIISDIHGNIDALNSVLKMLEKEEVDKIICLGDFIGRSRKI